MPEQVESLVKRANAALKSGDLAQAEALSRDALGLDKKNLGANLLLGTVLRRSGKNTDAVLHFSLVAELDPGRFSAQFAAGHLLLELGRLSEAVEYLKKAVNLRAENAQAQHCLAATLHHQGDFESALEHYQCAVELDPERAEFHNDLGVVQTHLGLSEAAGESYLRAFCLNPSRGKIAYHMAGHHHFRLDDPVLEVLTAEYERAVDDIPKRVYMAFALGKAHSDLEAWNSSYAFYKEGNSRYRETFNFSVKSEYDRFHRIRDQFVAGAELVGAATDTEGKVPVFIMGMPRSGTTLTEQILASHSRVTAIGESDYFGSFVRAKANQTGLSFPELLEETSPAELGRLGVQYLERWGAKLGDGGRLVEKTTLNFYYVGLLKRLFPLARFIHCVRDPLDTCWSIYSRYFVQGGHHYGYDLEELGQYYRLHMKFMEFWQEQYASSIHVLDYEALVDDPDAEIHSLLDFCGLDFESACLSFHETNRAVRTASAAQVRQPIYKTLKAAWAPYDEHLGPLKQALQGALTDKVD